MTLTRSQRSNLRKLADYLEGLPRRYRHFDMSGFLDNPEATLAPALEEKYARKNGGLSQFPCGTVACAIGHGPAAGILFRRAELTEDWGWVAGERFDYLSPDWDSYYLRFVPTGPMFEWAFGGGWSDADNHHWGAAARIRYLLAGKVPPDGSRSRHEGFHSHWDASADLKALYREFDKRHAKVAA